MSEHKPVIPYPWEWYSEKVQWMAMDKDRRVYAYEQEPQAFGADRVCSERHWADGPFIALGRLEGVRIAQACDVLGIPWYETKRQRPKGGDDGQ